MGNEFNTFNDDRYRLIGLYILLIAALVIWVFAGCTTPKEVVVENVRTEYVVRTDTVTRTDTVCHERETVVREANNGDSALLAKYGIRLRDNERLLLFLQSELERERSEVRESHTDTIIKVDTIQVPIPVERKLNKWETFCLDYGKVMTGTSIAFVFAIAYWFLRFIRRKVI